MKTTLVQILPNGNAVRIKEMADPDKELDSPPWWHVNCDGYGGGSSMGQV